MIFPDRRRSAVPTETSHAQLRAMAKEFKRGNRTAYYVGKWLMIAALVWAIFW